MLLPVQPNLNIKTEECFCKICSSGPPPKTAFTFYLIYLIPELAQDKLMSIVLAAAGEETLCTSLSTWFLTSEGKTP